MGDVVETFPRVLPTYEDKADLGTLPEYNSENKAVAQEWDDITQVVSALGRAAKLTALAAGLAPPTQALNGVAVRYTGIDATSQLPNVSTGLAAELDRAWAAMFEKIAEGGSLSGTLSASGFFGVHEGVVTIASGAFPTGTFLRLLSGGTFAAFTAGGTIAPIARVIDATTAYVDLTGRVVADGSTLEYDANGKLGLKIGANGTFDDLTVRERFETQETTVAQFTADQNNFAIPEATFMRMSTDASRTLTGMANIVDGRQLIITNVGSFNLVLAHENAGSSATNRIDIPTNSDLTLTPDDSALLIYDSITGRWRVTSSSAFAGGVADFSDGGEAGGADRTLGNTDNFDLGFLTNNLERLHIQSDGKIGINKTSGITGMLDIQTLTAATIGLFIQSSPSHSANLIEVQDSVGSILAFVDFNGVIVSGGGSVGADDFVKLDGPAGILEVHGVGNAAKLLLDARTGVVDTFISFTDGNAGNEWAVGVDDSDTQAWKISRNTILGVNDFFKIEKTTGDIFITPGHLVLSTTAGITANAGGGQAGATLLTSNYNEVSTVASGGDSVKLETAQAGLRQTIINNGANDAAVFPNTGDDLGAGVDTSVILASGNNITYVAYDATNWESI